MACIALVESLFKKSHSAASLQFRQQELVFAPQVV